MTWSSDRELSVDRRSAAECHSINTLPTDCSRLSKICFWERNYRSITPVRAFSRQVLTELPLLENSDDFVFDDQILAQCVYFGFRIGEVSCPTKYFEEASPINFRRSVKYGLGVLGTTLQFLFQKWGLLHLRRFSAKEKNFRRSPATIHAARMAAKLASSSKL
jgi:hypothetical protein